MSNVLGYTVVTHYADKTTRELKVTAEQAAAIVAVAGGGRTGGKYQYINADECPEHGPWRAVPAGNRKSDGKPYPAFWACDQPQGEERCTYKPSREWEETHPAERHFAGPDQAPTPEPTGQSAAGQYDDLPF